MAGARMTRGRRAYPPARLSIHASEGVVDGVHTQKSSVNMAVGHIFQGSRAWLAPLAQCALGDLRKPQPILSL